MHVEDVEASGRQRWLHRVFWCRIIAASIPSLWWTTLLSVLGLGKTFVPKRSVWLAKCGKTQIKCLFPESKFLKWFMPEIINEVAGPQLPQCPHWLLGPVSPSRKVWTFSLPPYLLCPVHWSVQSSQAHTSDSWALPSLLPLPHSQDRGTKPCQSCFFKVSGTHLFSSIMLLPSSKLPSSLAYTICTSFLWNTFLSTVLLSS